jgi:Cu(I)/Ag(I) efflux system membrane protein CusA/SilA
MIEAVIDYCARNRFIVILIFILVIGAGVHAVLNTPVDAIPDLSDNQVIISTDWMGRSPQVVQDQVTYPLVTTMQGIPHVRAVRGLSLFGFSAVYVIFDDNVDIYWARSRVLERLAVAKEKLPSDVSPQMGPDGTGVGHVYWYTVEGDGYNLAQLRAVQDWYIRYQLTTVPGVSEVASIGGFVKEYQIDLDPQKMRSLGVSTQMVMMAAQKSNSEVGGGIYEQNGMEYYIRGRGYVKGIDDVKNTVVETRMGTPIYMKDIAAVQMGTSMRRGALEKNGDGEVVGGIIVMRYGANADRVIRAVKQKIADISPGLPKGVKIVSAYDRSDLIERSVHTLKKALTEEMIVVSIVVLIFLFDITSALVIVLTLPVAILISFILMLYFRINSNIMSLGGIAIAIGVMVDAGIVLVENAYRHIAEGEGAHGASRLDTIIRACKQVGRSIFFSMVIITIAFMPIFLLTGQEGRLFKPLAFTKTFAMAGATILSITLTPVLMVLLMRWKMRPESKNPVSQFFIRIYMPFLKLALRFRAATVILAIAALVATVPVYLSLGSEFMPPLDEGSLLFMPTMLPNVNVNLAKHVMQVQDAIIRQEPEVAQVLGKVGRAETATDPAPMSMIETIITLKPKSEWRAGMTKDKIISELDAKLHIPGVVNMWTMPIINRINMLSTGIRTNLGVKIFGSDLTKLDELATQAQGILSVIPGAANVAPELSSGANYLDINIDRQAAARYGVAVGDIQDVVQTALGGMPLTTTVEGLQRFPLRIRFMREVRDSPQAIGDLPIPAANMAMVPLKQVAHIEVTGGPAMIQSEGGLVRSVVLVNVMGRDMGSFVAEAKRAIAEKLKLPTGYYVVWSGQYENQVAAAKRFRVVIPIVLLVIVIFLYFTFNNLTESLMVLLSVPFALVGGILFLKAMNFNISVAVVVGIIALFGVAVETGVVMLIYLNEALDKRINRGGVTRADIYEATIEGAALRLRPKMMTVAVNMIGLLPIMWSTGTGSDVMKPIATPLLGGMATSTIMVLIVVPVIFALAKEFQLRRGALRHSAIKH